jgi:DNA-binding transcriptional MerR regulator
MKTVFTISELAKEFGLTARAIRFYEQEGLIAPSRQGQMRLFSARDRARLALITRGKRVGFALADIREMLDLYDVGDGQVTQLKVSRKKFADRVVALEQQRIDIDAAIEELRTGIAWIDEQIVKGEEAEARDKSLNLVGYGVMPRTGSE